MKNVYIDLAFLRKSMEDRVKQINSEIADRNGYGLTPELYSELFEEKKRIEKWVADIMSIHEYIDEKNPDLFGNDG